MTQPISLVIYNHMVIYKRTKTSRVFHALADATRACIVEKLAQRDLPVMELVRLFEISQPAVTKHLDVLEKAGLIARRKLGRQRLCRLKPEALAVSIGWLDSCRSYWNARLDALEEYLAESPSKEK